MPPSRKKPKPKHQFTNQRYSDLEILANIQSVAGMGGWASTTEIAVACGFTANGDRNVTPATKVASRLAYMRDGLLLESAKPTRDDPWREPGDKDTHWRLTAFGVEMLKGQLTAPVNKAMERMDPGEVVLMMRELTERAWVQGEVAMAFAIRRQYEHTKAKRKLVFRVKQK